MAVEDILDDDLTEDNIRITVERIFDLQVGKDLTGLSSKSRTPRESKSLIGVYDLIRKAIEDMEKRQRTPQENKITFTEEEPDNKALTEVITFSLIKREPGAYGQGSPFESNVRNLRPIFREEQDDPENPGYRIATTGYWHDNIIRLTCWAQTNKTANARAEWLENLMEEYSWFFKAEGVARVLFWGRDSDIIKSIDNNKWYGRPMDYFVRTETIRAFSEKKIEEILLKVAEPHQEY